MNADQAKFLAEYLTGLIERESAMTAKVIEAVPDTGHAYKPDAKSRTAWELATHLATADVWFLQSIIDGAFAWDAEGAQQAVAQFKSAKDVVAFYQREVPARLAALRALPGDRLAKSIDFFGFKTLKVVHNVDQTFGGHFGPSTPSPGRNSTACTHGSPPSWAS